MNLKFWQREQHATEPMTIADVAATHREAYAQFIRGLNWKDFGSEPEMIWVYTDNAGNNYYVARDIWAGISRERLAALEMAGIELESRMKQGALLESLLGIMAQCKRAQMGEVEGGYEAYKLTYDMYETMRASPSEAVLMEYAVNLIYTDGENPQQLSPSIMQEKRNRAGNDIELRAFFLDMALSITQTSLPISQPDGPGSLSGPESQQSRKEASRSAVNRFIQASEQKKK